MEYLARIKKLYPDEEEAQDILEYDRAVEKDSTKLLDYDLSPDREKIAQIFAHTGTRRVPTTYKFTQRQRKPNATKGGIITEIAEFLGKNSQFSVENLEIVNKERQITFKIGENKFELVLTQKRSPKK